jgi:hypothetical protein
MIIVSESLNGKFAINLKEVVSIQQVGSPATEIAFIGKAGTVVCQRKYFSSTLLAEDFDNFISYWKGIQ